MVHALANDGWNVTIAARRIEQARQLATFFTQHALRDYTLSEVEGAQHKLQITNYDSFILHPSSFILLVNATPIGMTPNIDQSPWPENSPFPNAAIYDLVYNPRETKLVKDARAQGLQATTGLGMLIEQAALAFEKWTGYNPPREIMRASIKQISNL